MRFRVKGTAQRGAALSETALVVGVILIMILGSVQLGIIGYVQMTADAAAFLSAHQQVTGDSQTQAENVASSVFPQIAPGDFSATAAPAPLPTVYVDYGYNDQSAIVRANSINNRHGGATMMEPSQLTSVVNKGSVASILGVPLAVEGSMIEPQWMENGAHFDVANSANYGQAGANFQVNYFTNGENTPPYYVGFNYIENCADPQPWSSAQQGCSQPVQFRALGIAEHLDDSDWTLPNGEINTSGGNLAFVQVACHQRVYANLATFFANNSALGSLQTTPGVAVSTQGNGDYVTWGNTAGEGFQSSPTVAGPVTGLQADQNIRQVYSWDVIVNGGYPPSTYTGVGTFPFPFGGAASTGVPYSYGTIC